LGFWWTGEIDANLTVATSHLLQVKPWTQLEPSQGKRPYAAIPANLRTGAAEAAPT
jgi:hypothetical protein